VNLARVGPIAVAVLLGFAFTGSAAPGPTRPDSELRSAAAAATRAYRDAWLTNRPDAVMATLAAEAVLLPSGLEPIVGPAAIRRFWWPADGPATTVTAMEQAIDEIAGDGGLAVVRGHGSLTFTTRRDGRDEVRSQRSTFVNVIQRQADGRWLITHRMWSDLR
jgi:ketosteroid isomerase-like protein